MDFKEYWLGLSVDERKSFAESVGAKFGYLRNVAYGDRRASVSLAVEIELASHGKVKRNEMRSDIDWRRWDALSRRTA